jgi:hypothetical protein
MNDSKPPPDVTTIYRFAAIPEWVLYHPDLSAICVRLYGALARHGTDQDRCYPSQARLAHLCGISERSVQAPLRQLEKVGAIRRHLSEGRSTRYELAGDTPLEADPDPAPYNAGCAFDSAGADEEGALDSADPASHSADRPASHSAGRSALYSAPKESQLNESQLNEKPSSQSDLQPARNDVWREERNKPPPPNPMVSDWTTVRRLASQGNHSWREHPDLSPLARRAASEVAVTIRYESADTARIAFFEAWKQLALEGVS